MEALLGKARHRTLKPRPLGRRRDLTWRAGGKGGRSQVFSFSISLSAPHQIKHCNASVTCFMRLRRVIPVIWIRWRVACYPFAWGGNQALSVFADSDKAYDATISFGIKTTTGDSEGEVPAEQTAEVLTTDHVTAALTSFVGEFDQTPPMHSALKVDGQPLYKLARQGKEVERKSRRITVHSIKMTSFAPGVVATSDIRVSCSKGTYIRTLSEDIAEAVGLPGHMSALRRTATGPFDLSQSIDLQTLVDVAERKAPTRLTSFSSIPRLLWVTSRGSNSVILRLST